MRRDLEAASPPVAPAPQSAWDAFKRQYLTNQGIVLVGALLTLISSRSVDQTIYYRLAAGYSNYVWYLGAIVLPIAFLVLSWPVVWWKMMYTEDISDEMRSFPQYKYAIMGFLDTLFNLLSTWPIVPLGGTTANVLSQLVLPFNMLGSLLFLNIRYRKVHYIGSTLAVYGVLVRMIPNITGQSEEGGTATGWAYAGWVCMLAAAQVPAAASNVYKEIGLKGYDLDVWYMNAWIGVWQLLWGIATSPTIALGLTQSTIKLSDLPSYVTAANKCLFGTNTQPTDQCDDPVSGVPVVVFCFFIVFNVTYNQLMLFVFKRGSSVLFVIASAVRLPLVDLLLLSSFIAGRAQQRFSIYDGFSLFALVLAIVTYYSEKEERRVLDEEEHVTYVPQTPQMSPQAQNARRGASADREAGFVQRMFGGSRSGSGDAPVLRDSVGPQGNLGRSSSARLLARPTQRTALLSKKR